MEPIPLQEKRSPLDKRSPLCRTCSPIKQRLTFEGTGIDKSFLDKGTRYMPSVPWDWQGGEKYPYGVTPRSDEVRKTKTTVGLKAGIDWGKFSLFGEASASGETFLNKPFKGFQEDLTYSDATIQSQTQEGWPITVTGQRDVAGSTHTTFGDIYKKRIGGGAKIHLGGDSQGGSEPSLMAILEGSGGAQKTSQTYYTKVATGKPLSTASNMWAGYAGGGPGSHSSELSSSGTTTSTKPYGSGKLSILYGRKGEAGNPGCFGGFCSTKDSPTWNIGVFGEHDTDAGTSFGVTGTYGMI